jgi:pentapeptide MXKDX repeat protein
MKKSVLLSAILSAALATGFAFAPAAYAGDMKKDTKMKKEDTMGKETSMSKDNGMKKEGTMGKDSSMSKDSGMKK